MWAILIGRVECGLTWWQRKNQSGMACIHRLETKLVAEEGAVRFCIFAVNNDVSARDHTHLLFNVSPTKKSTGLKTGHYKLRDALKRAPTMSC